ncbi:MULTISPECIES: GtrA family protein [Stenotrophomonas maltophilia group]|uniref:GtrA family protein n=1 Tax=Stenotrophomonas maltophilia group TaxID=995085 RepID=UPI0015DDCF85|nr:MULTISPECIES: GtrA family protein [Stenotrophomonas maltophilia group]MBA0401860.1 GtrA family protein [Stenotrophomonas maltophilia]HEL2966977.1 GtrA family protein [Stenotrophomonas maltophilia]
MSGRFFRFLISGGTAAAVEYLVFLLIQLSLGERWLVLSQTLSFGCGFVASFLLNRSWVFRSSGAMKAELLKYGAIAAFNLVAGNAAMLLLTGPADLDQYISKLLVMGCIAGWNYLIFSKLIFKQQTGKA